jgi:two-component system response regulator AtoC
MTRILYVEDEADLREALAEELQEDGFDVLAASNGEEGLQLLASFRPDLVITDWLMPRMTGIELIREMRTALPDFALTPVIFLSAYSAKPHIDEAMAAGACHYITKPVDYAKLLRAIAEFGESSCGAASLRCRCHMTLPEMAGSD